MQDAASYALDAVPGFAGSVVEHRFDAEGVDCLKVVVLGR